MKIRDARCFEENQDDQGQGFLKQYASKSSEFQFFKPPHDRAVEVIFLKCEPVQNYFDEKGHIIPRYHLEVDGKIQYWDRPSKSLAQQMAQFEPGTRISIRM